MATHINQPYDHEISIMEGMQNFSPVSPAYNANPYRTPYPDSNATSTSSATSPDPALGVVADSVIVEADEDKRKRNQAASARFRQKKKQREQSLMEASREMQEKTKKLESENDGLRKENLFLKKLLVEKLDHMSEEDRDLLLNATGTALRKKV
jgi:Skp family chaperone for outer membrane proteins